MQLSLWKGIINRAWAAWVRHKFAPVPVAVLIAATHSHTYTHTYTIYIYILALLEPATDCLREHKKNLSTVKRWCGAIKKEKPI